MVPPAPVLLSTTTVWPSDLASSSAKMRATMSAVAPGASGTIRRIDLAGYACARATPEAATSVAARSALFVRTIVAPCLEPHRLRHQPCQLPAQPRHGLAFALPVDEIVHLVRIGLEVVELVARHAVERFLRPVDVLVP